MKHKFYSKRLVIIRVETAALFDFDGRITRKLSKGTKAYIVGENAANPPYSYANRCIVVTDEGCFGLIRLHDLENA